MSIEARSESFQNNGTVSANRNKIKDSGLGFFQTFCQTFYNLFLDRLLDQLKVNDIANSVSNYLILITNILGFYFL